MGAPMHTTVDALVARYFRLPLTNAGQLPDRAALEAAQMATLRATVAHAQAHSPYYRKRLQGLDPDRLQTRSDLATLPLLTARDLLEADLLAVSQSRVSRVMTLHTSGTTGPAKRLSFGAEDVAITTDFFLHGMQSLITPEDRVLVLLPFQTPASTGAILLEALQSAGIRAQGCWPPPQDDAVTPLVLEQHITSVVGLPQHLLAFAEAAPAGHLHTMLLCADYAPSALRQRIEAACGCTTFLHYGSTESGLGGAVECGRHDGCHIWESALLVEIIDPQTAMPCPDGQPGEIVFTTLNRVAMPLIRYRTGDRATLDHTPCTCGGKTARLHAICGRLTSYPLHAGGCLTSQELSDALYTVPGLLDYRAQLSQEGPDMPDRLDLEVLTRSTPGRDSLEKDITAALAGIPAVAAHLTTHTLQLGRIQGVDHFPPSHTVKHTIVDQRQKGVCHAIATEHPY